MSQTRRDRLRIGFIMELVLGHVTWYQNLRSAVTALDSVDAHWVETTLYNPNGLLERTPGVPAYIRAGGRAWLDVQRGLRGRACDVLFFNTHKAAMFRQWDMLRTPTILMTDVTPVQYDDMADLYEHAVDRNRLVRTLKHRANVLNFHLAAGIIVSSRWTRDSFIDDYGVAPERVHIIPIGADTTYWRPEPARRSTRRAQLLFVGGHFERKGGRLLLDVFRELGLRDRADLHIVTRSPDVEAEPGVFVHRDINNNSLDLLHLYQAADVFVLPTLADCFANASIEAMATGLPVITTALGGIPDVVEHSANGFLLPPGDGRQLAEALLHMVDNPQMRHAFGAEARRRAETRFDSRVNAGRMLEVADQIYTERANPRHRTAA